MRRVDADTRHERDAHRKTGRVGDRIHPAIRVRGGCGTEAAADTCIFIQIMAGCNAGFGNAPAGRKKNFLFRRGGME